MTVAGEASISAEQAEEREVLEQVAAQRRKVGVQRLIDRVLLTTAIMLIWELAVRSGLVHPFFISQPTRILVDLWTMFSTGYVFPHLAITLCRCMNIPARYCTGYLGDIGVPAAPEPMDFSAWFEAYLDGRWYTFDARHNTPRIGRVLMARGRDATDVALSTSFGPAKLAGFRVVTDEVPAAVAAE